MEITDRDIENAAKAILKTQGHGRFLSSTGLYSMPIWLRAKRYAKVSLESFAEQHEVEKCHCGEPVVYGFDGDSTHHRGMCQHCDAVRCDTDPYNCGR